MASHRTVFDATLAGGITTVGASATNTVVSRVFGIPTNALSILIAIKLSAATKTTGITFQLQTASMNDDAATPAPMWTTATGCTATVASTTADAVVVELRAGWWNTAQVAAFPLGMNGRLVCTTGANDSVSVETVSVIQSNH